MSAQYHIRANALAQTSEAVQAGTAEVWPSGKSRIPKKEQAKSDVKPLLALDYKKIILIFVAGSILGLLLETGYHLVVDGVIQKRFGLVWGPFSPLYGFGAIAMTLVLNRIWNCPAGVIFVATALVGTIVEFACSWGMEYFFGAVCWDYSGTFMNIEGRINLRFTLMWGALGLAWTRIVMPFLNNSFELINWKSLFLKILTPLLSAFLVVNMIVTVSAFERESERVSGIPATSSTDVFLDEHFSSEWMQERFENMSIHGTSRH